MKNSRIVVGRDKQEQEALLLIRRNEFEQALRLNRLDIPQWCRYANLEFINGNIEQSASIYERALNVDYTKNEIWLQFSQMLLNSNTTNCLERASDVLRRACELLPNEDTLWYKRLSILRKMNDQKKLLEVCEEWVNRVGCEDAFRYLHKISRSSNLVDKWILKHPCSLEAWKLKVQNAIASNEDVSVTCKQAISQLGDNTEDIYDLWTEYELRRGNFLEAFRLRKESGRAINDNWSISKWRVELENSKVPKETKSEMYMYAIGSYKQGNDTIRNNKNLKNDEDYEKLCLDYCKFCEVEYNEYTVCQAYKFCLDYDYNEIAPSSQLWICLGQYLIEHNNLTQARKTLGMAIGKTMNFQECNLDIIKFYIQLETKQSCTERVRTLYLKQCELWPLTTQVWVDYAHFEMKLENYERVEALLRLALSQDLDEPLEVLQLLVDINYDHKDTESARKVYAEYLSGSTKISQSDIYAQFALFELSLDPSDLNSARQIFDRGLIDLQSNRQQMLELLDLYVLFEQEYGDIDSLENLRNRANEITDDSRKQPETLSSTVTNDSINKDVVHSTAEKDTFDEQELKTQTPEQSEAIKNLLADAIEWDATG